MSGRSDRVSQVINGSIEGGETLMDPFDRRYCFYAHPDEGLSYSQNGCATFPNHSGTGVESLTFDRCIRPGSTASRMLIHVQRRFQ